MRIAVASLKYYKGLQEVRIVPPADVALVLITGENGAGKTSVLDAIDACLRGKKAIAEQPVHTGAAQCELDITMDTGLRVERVIEPDGETALEVTNADGSALKAPQTTLDRLIASRFIDPLEFLRRKAPEQLEVLLQLIDADGAIAALETQRKYLFDARTASGRELTKAEGELARLPEVTVLEPISVAALAEERTAISERQRHSNTLDGIARSAERDVRDATESELGAKQRVERLERELAAATQAAAAAIKLTNDKLRAAEDARSAADQAARDVAAQRARRDEIEVALATADQRNRAAYASAEAAKRRTEVANFVAVKTAERAEMTSAIERIEAAKADRLANSPMPIPGLGFDARGITLNGLPFSQGSGADRFRVALGLAIAGSSGLDDILLRDGGILTPTMIETIKRDCSAAGKRAWIERVTPDAGAIRIVAGRVVES